MKKLTEYNFPHDLELMGIPELKELSDEIRSFLVENVSKTGGHLASNLGVTELTVAMHKVFDSPKDRILFDVGHQSYVHKILTGRADRFGSLRQLDGLSGFPKRAESPHDVYDAGHSSDSISIALGIAQARDLKGEDFNVVAVIGDGALTGGVAYEALNNAGASGSKLIIIINDNQMSISPNVGGMTQHLSRLRVSPAYTDMKNRLRERLSGGGALKEGVYRGLEIMRDNLKRAVLPEKNLSMFENLGFKYYGPIDGHDVEEVMDFLMAARRMNGPVILHVVTKKGKGFASIEENASAFHGVGPFDPDTMLPPSGSGRPSYSAVFGDKLTELAGKDPRVVAVSAAMIDGTGLQSMQEKFPDRTFDVGIAEQHAVSFASGMALNGMRPFVAVYSTFLQRAYDEIITDVCLQKLPVVFCIDRAGNVGADGETHNGQFDLSYLSHMPNLRVLAPCCREELEQMMEYALTLDSPCAIRYPRGEAITLESLAEKAGSESIGPLEISGGGCLELKKGTEAVIFTTGKYAVQALEASAVLEKQGISCGVVHFGCVKPVDREGLIRHAEGKKLIITLEDNVVAGGFGSIVNDVFSGIYKHPEIMNLGWPVEFIKSGKTSELEKLFGLDGASIAEAIRENL